MERGGEVTYHCPGRHMTLIRFARRTGYLLMRSLFYRSMCSVSDTKFKALQAGLSLVLTAIGGGLS